MASNILDTRDYQVVMKEVLPTQVGLLSWEATSMKSYKGDIVMVYR